MLPNSLQKIIDKIRPLVSFKKEIPNPSVKTGHWSHEDKEVILNNFPILSDKELGALLNRSAVAVKSYRQRHLIRKKDFNK